MSTISLPFAFRVGESTGRPGTLPFDVAFRVGTGIGRPGVASLTVAFRVEGLGIPATLSLPVSFQVKGADPTILVLGGQSEWEASVQRAWDGSAWFPPVTP